MFLHLYICIYTYIHIYMCMCVCVCVHRYTYMKIFRHRWIDGYIEGERRKACQRYTSYVFTCVRIETVQRWRLFRSGGNGGCRRRLFGKLEFRHLREERRRERRCQRDCCGFRLEGGISLLLDILVAEYFVKEGRKLKKKVREEES